MQAKTRAQSLGAAVLITAAGAMGTLHCKPQDEPQGAAPGAPPPAQASSSARSAQPWDELDIEVYAAAEVTIEHLRKQATVDWPAIRAEVAKTMAVVRATDERHGLTYATEIPAALTQCEKGEAPRVNQQVVAKGLQHVAVLGIAHELGLLERAGAADRPQHAARVASFAKAIRPTFVRRDKDYFEGKPTLVAALDQAVSQVAAAAKAGQSAKEPGQALRDVIDRTYALSLRYEIEQVEKLRLKDLKACEVKRAEAVIFYRIIAKRVSNQSPEAHGTIEAMLKAAPDQMNAAILKEQLKKGLPTLPFPE